MDGDAGGAGALAGAGGGDDVGLDVVGLRHGGVAGLAEGGDVVDIDAEFEGVAWGDSGFGGANDGNGGRR